MTTQPRSVDQSDRIVPINLRQSGRTPTELLISTRVRKSPYWHLSHRAGCWRATVYNRIYHPRGYVRPEDGGAAAEHEALTNHVTMWNVAVERQIRVQGPDAERFVDYVITRDATRIEPMHGKYVILCNERGGILNDPVLLRLSEDEFWFSLADSDLLFWAAGHQRWPAHGRRDRRDRCLSGADPGPQVGGADGRPGGRGHPPHPLLRHPGSRGRRLPGSDLAIRLLRREGLRDLPARRHSARRGDVERGAGGGQGAPALGDRPRPPAPHPGRHHVLGPGHRPRDGAVPVRPGLPGAAPQEGRLHRQGGAGARP